ncbi:MAG: hypothetical protein ACREB2_06565 [Pseudolabrys sp.]
MRHRAVTKIALVCAAALALADCRNTAGVFTDTNEGGWFSKPLGLFDKPDWARPTGGFSKVSLGPSGPVAPEDLVAADGRCGAPIVEAAPPAAAPSSPPPEQPPERPVDRPVGSMAGDLASAPMPIATPVSANPNPAPPEPPPGTPQIMGGIALGMSECDVVRRAGLPSNVNIGAGDKGERRAVLTYLTGTWPGIYTFNAGRLKIVDRAPGPPPSARPPVKKKTAKKKPVKPKTAKREVERAYVQ